MVACPEIKQYTQLATGQLSPAATEALLDHLQGCSACVQRVESLSERDTLVDLIRQARTLSEGLAGENIGKLVERLRALRPSAAATEGTSPEIRLACSACGKSLKVPAALAGKKARCPLCQAVIVVSCAAPSAAAPPAPVVEAATLGPPEVSARGKTAGTVSEPSSGASAPARPNPELYAFLAPAQSPDELGRLGPYRILKVLGAGGMGVVFQAEDPQLQRLVALKAMLPGLATSEAAKQRFLREARAAAKLKHDHIVTIHQVGEDRGAPFLAMEFLEGESLDERLVRAGTLPVLEILRIGREMAEGLAAAHERGLIHRDIKPGNVWLETSPGRKSGGGRVKILDFGLARAASGEAHLTQSGVIVGTPAFMAPEQAQGKNVDPRCDLFSLGCVLYRMSTGEQPFRGTDVISTLMAVATDHPAPPLSRNLELPTELSDLIMQLLAKDPRDRPATAQMVVETLERLAQEELSPNASKAASPPKKSPARTGNTRRRLAAAAVAVALVAGLAVWFSGILVRVETKDGTLTIKTDDPTVAVKITPDGGATVTYGKERRQISLKPGKYGIELAGGRDGHKLSATQFTIASGKSRTIEITWEQTAGGPSTGSRTGSTKDPPGLPPIAVAPFNQDQAKAYQEAWAKHLGKKVIEENSIGMKLVLIPPGKFMRGSSESDKHAIPEDQPQHEVELTQPFFMAAHEVTQEQFEKIMGRNPSGFSSKGVISNAVKALDTRKFPVEMVTWYDAVEFCNKLSEKESKRPSYELTKIQRDPKENFIASATVRIQGGDGYRLPTEAEWEYACRAGTTTPWFSGNSDSTLGDYAWDRITSGSRVHAIGEKKPNFFGLHDMYGNGWEWCQDWKAFYTKDAVRDPTGPQSGATRVFRGGSWFDTSETIRSANRNHMDPNSRHGTIGFRVVCAARALHYTNALGMEFALVPKGKAWLGGGGGKPGSKEVEFKDDFYLGVYEVTQAEWEKVMNSNPSTFKAVAGVGKEDQKRCPVEHISWDDCQLFVTRLNQKVKEGGWVYRLPKEAEWEYACRGGPFCEKADSAFDYYLDKPANQLLPDQANFDHGTGPKRTCKVGSYQPNRLGLYDMHGNVFEWCEDDALDPKSPLGPSGLLGGRVLRGGNWLDGAAGCRAARRYSEAPTRQGGNIGLRLARVPIARELVPSTETDPAPKIVPPAPSAALEALRREQISPEALAAAGGGDAKKAPAQLVAVLGEPQPIQTGSIRSLAFSPDGRWLASASADSTVFLRDADVGKAHRVLRGHKGSVEAVAFSNDGKTLASTGADGSIRLWPVDTEAAPQVLEPKLGPMGAMAASADGRFLAAGGSSKVNLWTWGAWDKPLHTIPAKGRVTSLVFSPDGETLAIGTDEQKAERFISLHKTGTGELAHAWPAHKGGIDALSYSQNGKMLASTGGNSTNVWELATRKPVVAYDTFRNFRPIAFHPDGSRLFLAGENGVQGNFFDVATKKVTRSILGWRGFMSAAAFRPDGKRMALGTDWGLVELRDPDTWQPRAFTRGHAHILNGLAVGPDGILLSAGDDYTLRRWDLARPGENKILIQFDRSIWGLAISPDGKTFVTSAIYEHYDSAQRGVFWDVATGKRRFAIHPYAHLYTMAFSPDSKVIAGCSHMNGSTYLWDAATGKQVHQFPKAGHCDPPAFSGDGKLLAAAHWDSKVIKVWKVASGEVIHSLEDLPATCGALNHDGRFLATGYGDGTIGFWDLLASKPVKRVLSGHSGRINKLRFTPDGKTIVSSSTDGTIRLWSPAQPRALKEIITVGAFPKLPPQFNSISPGLAIDFDLDPSGRYLFAAGHGPLIYVLRLDHDAREPATGTKAALQAP